MSIIDDVEKYLALPDDSESWDLLKRCLEEMRDNQYFMTEIRGMVRPIITNSAHILEAATPPETSSP